MGVIPVCYSQKELEEVEEAEDEEMSVYGFSSTKTVPMARGVLVNTVSERERTADESNSRSYESSRGSLKNI